LVARDDADKAAENHGCFPNSKSSRDAPAFGRLSLMTFETNSSVAMAAFNKLLGNVRSEVRQKTHYKQWEVYGREKKEGKVMHSTRFACRQVSGVSVIVQITWPHLQSNGDRYESEMENLLRTALDSVTSGIGSLPEREGEQIFRWL
jgi:hypothetical protein